MLEAGFPTEEIEDAITGVGRIDMWYNLYVEGHCAVCMGVRW